MTKLPFNQRVKKAREHRGLTQAELGGAIGKTQKHIERMENRKEGRHSYFTAEVAAVCGVSPLWLATGDGEMVRPADIPDDALALGAAWSYIRGGARDTMAISMLSTALSFMPTSHPLYRHADKLYRDSAKRQGIKAELQGRK